MENNAPTNTTKSEFNKNNLSVPSARSTASRHGLMKITRKRLFSETLITYLEKKNKKKKNMWVHAIVAFTFTRQSILGVLLWVGSGWYGGVYPVMSLI